MWTRIKSQNPFWSNFGFVWFCTILSCPIRDFQCKNRTQCKWAGPLQHFQILGHGEASNPVIQGATSNNPQIESMVPSASGTICKMIYIVVIFAHYFWVAKTSKVLDGSISSKHDSCEIQSTQWVHRSDAISNRQGCFRCFPGLNITFSIYLRLGGATLRWQWWGSAHVITLPMPTFFDWLDLSQAQSGSGNAKTSRMGRSILYHTLYIYIIIINCLYIPIISNYTRQHFCLALIPCFMTWHLQVKNHTLWGHGPSNNSNLELQSKVICACTRWECGVQSMGLSMLQSVTNCFHMPLAFQNLKGCCKKSSTKHGMPVSYQLEQKVGPSFWGPCVACKQPDGRGAAWQPQTVGFFTIFQ